jgi:hypothetical protein
MLPDSIWKIEWKISKLNYDWGRWMYAGRRHISLREKQKKAASAADLSRAR